MKPSVFEKDISVTSSAIDQMGHVNNVQYLQWVQDIAEAHWTSRSSSDELEKYAWVALEHHIKYHAPGFVDETITLQTWVEKFEGVKSIRHTKIYRKKDDKILVTAVTHWCLLAMPKGRPLRVPIEILDKF